MICKIEGCGRAHYGNGLCRPHYMRVRRHGSTDALLRPHGAGCIRSDGYVIRDLDGVTKMEHVRIAERALGHDLPPEAQVHHVNEIRSDNRNENLVICPSNEYHKLLHRRMWALDACGHADWRKCGYCGQYDAAENMRVYEFNAQHARCQIEYAASQRKKRKEKTA